MRHNLMNTDLVTVNMSLKGERLIKNNTYIILQVQDNLISTSYLTRKVISNTAFE